MNYHNITKYDMLNGMGLRVVLWVSHCEHNCKNCHNPQTHGYNSGIEFDSMAKEELFAELSKEEIKGITLSGGDPLSTLNREYITLLLKEIKSKFKTKDVWCYTGYTWDDIKNIEVIKYVDILIDGKFQEELSLPSPKWCGSSNQRIIDVQESLKQDKTILYN
ncbi:anaerobic ribonucleoside-triphosphate reductase activating protein [uncultured Clostridium sp.]|uniref:anaerobic ribonucleoside-triphosphate reductase activating protein n=1 Tax=uncultured Clostridium sp. TaxID=59620 RepID=UPI00321682C0